MMNLFPEQRAELTRLALGCTGFPDRSLLRELIGWLAELVIIEPDCAIPRAKLHLVGEQGLIMLPRGLFAEQIDRSLLHEIAHFLLKHQTAAFFREQGDMSSRAHRVLTRRWEMAEESEVFAFLLAFSLPARLVHVLQDRQLVEQSGCHVDLVRLRRHRLAGKLLDLREPPHWSAHRKYEVVFCSEGTQSLFHVHHREPGQPGYVVRVEPREVREWRFRINADLMALTVPEWRLKYRWAEVHPPESAAMRLNELRIASGEWPAGFASTVRLGSAAPIVGTVLTTTRR